jgi:MarC family membrane protein
MLSLNEYAQILLALLAILNPLIAVPTFAELTADEPSGKRTRIALVTAVSVFILLCGAAAFGQQVLLVFRIDISAFRVGGGILILLMAISMLQARIHKSKQTIEESHEAEDKDTIAVVPLAIPMLAGPGSISTIIVYSHLANGITHRITLCGIALIVAITAFLILRISNRVARTLGKTGMNIVTRLMGLLLAAIGVQFITTGLRALLPGLD